MLRHVVLFKMKPSEGGRTAEENLLDLRGRLEALPGTIPGILRYEVGVNMNPTPHACDLALYSEFDDLMGLAAYQKHPAHQEVVTFVNRVCRERHVVDWET
jgi:hypothetical protein